MGESRSHTVTLQNSDFVPWHWTIKPAAGNVSQCPGPSKILGTFAWINITVSLLSIIFGHRAVTGIMTCKGPRRGLDKNHPETFDYYRSLLSYRVTWLFPLALHLGANTLNAYLMQRAAGFETTYGIGELTIWLVVRPRTGVLVLLIIDVLYSNNMSDDKEDIFKCVYKISCIANNIAELVLQCLSVHTTAKVAHFAAKRGYYIVWANEYKDVPGGAKIMYAAALAHTIMFSLFILVNVRIGIVGWWDGDWAGTEIVTYPAFAVFYLPLPWIASWVFWAGYLKLAGESYCPPLLNTQGGIWTAFSILGIFLGGVGA